MGPMTPSLTREYWLGSVDGAMSAGSVELALWTYLPALKSLTMIDFAALVKILT